MLQKISMGLSTPIYTFHDGGRYLTLAYQPYHWLRVYLFGKTLEIGGVDYA